MSEDQNTENEVDVNDDLPQEDELESLKNRATQMGISFHPSIGVDKLRDKINAELASENADETDDEGPVEEENGNEANPPSSAKTQGATTLTPAQIERNRIRRLRKRASKLHRVRIACMNANKREWEGEIFTAGNSVVGSLKKYVPFNVPWHVPEMILKMIKERKFQEFYTVRGPNGEKIRKGRIKPEFGIEVLPALSEEELKKLAQRQAMAAGTADEVND